MLPSMRARLPSCTSCSVPSLNSLPRFQASARGRDPWALMNPAEMAHLASLWARNSEFAAFHFNQGKFPIDYLKNEMFKALPAVDVAFAAFPAAVRSLIDEKRAPWPQWWFMAVIRHAKLTP